MSMKEAMRALGNVSRTHIYDLEKRGDLRILRRPSYIKGPVQVVREDVERILAKRTAA